ncbi:hypothetical protein V6N11_034819 [Hibiscus sabdariffa]|uniref:Uncharacterized protein n=2 Tax=Hibiscus sabdariffa TaxID=183260 RepID=A0ABR2BBG0_9ROSI
MFLEKVNDYDRDLESSRTIYNAQELVVGVFKDDLIINEEVAADVEEKEKRQTEKLIDNTSERNVLVGQVVGLVENSGLVVNLLEDRLVDPVQEKDFQKEPITTIGLDTELIAINGRATDIKELVNGSKEKCVEPKRSWTKVVEDLVNSGQAQSNNDQEVNSSETELEIEHFDFAEDKKGKKETKKLKLAEKDVREFWGDDDFGF